MHLCASSWLINQLYIDYLGNSSLLKSKKCSRHTHTPLFDLYDKNNDALEETARMNDMAYM